MRREAKKYLEDMRIAADLVERFTQGKTLDDYRSDPLIRSAVERQLEIVGEAMSQLAATDRATAERITDYRDIVAFRNRIVHGYWTVNHEVVWDAIGNALPVLRHEIEKLLAEAGR